MKSLCLEGLALFQLPHWYVIFYCTKIFRALNHKSCSWQIQHISVEHSLRNIFFLIVSFSFNFILLKVLENWFPSIYFCGDKHIAFQKLFPSSSMGHVFLQWLLCTWHYETGELKMPFYKTVFHTTILDFNSKNYV